MVKSRQDAVSNYRAGLDRVGAEAYRNAMNANSISDAAEALERGAGTDDVDFDRYESNYRDRY